MSYVDTLLSSNRLIPRRVKLSTCSGLERHLLDELNSLSLKFNLISRGKSFIDVSAGLDTIWSIIQNSRICRQLFIHVCDPFEALTPKHFIRELNSVDWASFIPFSNKLPPPSVKVLCSGSKLYHTRMIRNMVERSINSHCYRYKRAQGDDLPEFMKRRGYIPLCPRITVGINNNNCEVLADASGDLSERPWHKLSLLDDRIVPSATAAIIQEILSREELSNKTVIWDPFCHNGSLLLELLSYLKDEKLRTDSSNYPLNNFPLTTVLYEHKHLPRSNMIFNPNLTLLGTDPDPDNIKSANELVNKLETIEKDNIYLLFGDKEKESDSPGSLKIRFDCKGLKEVSVNMNETIILTNLYYGNKSMKSEYSSYHREFIKFIDSVRSKSSSVYVIAPRSFKKTSKLNWEPLLVFNNNGIIVELLKLK